MKRIINICLSAVLLAGLAVSCEKAPKVEEGIVAEWQLMEMTGYEAASLPSVYIEFKADRTFDLYQKVGDVMRYKKYDGTYTVSGSILKGEYSDGEDWGSDYRASFEADGEVLVLTAVTLDDAGNVASEGEVCRYTKASLGQTEKDAADIVTKSGEEASARFL